MKREYPPLYRRSRAEARRQRETQLHEDSFRQNVECARAIEQAIRDYADEDDPKGFLFDGCAQSVLAEYGFQRVEFVLANSLQNTGCQSLHSGEAVQWAQSHFVPRDGKFNRYFVVDTAAELLDKFVAQFRQSSQALGLFSDEHIDSSQLDYTGKVLILRPDRLKESCLSAQNQLWYGHCGFGCSPTSSGRAVFATCLGDGEEARLNRSDFIGVLDEQHLPDWAAERLAELRGPAQEQADGPAQDGMEMR